jgi:4-aminobutyrate aminotransferase
VLEKEGDMAAVIAETVRGTPVIPAPDFWRTVRQACDRHGALLILDEIITGLGRTGAMFACEHYGIVPDMLVLGKGLGGGIVPLAALATIEYIEARGLLSHARDLGRHALGRLAEMQARHPLIGDVRGLGLLIGIELVRDRRTRERARVEAEGVMYRSLSRGLSFKVTMGNILTLAPPLVISRGQMDEALDIVDACLTEVERA